MESLRASRAETASAVASVNATLAALEVSIGGFAARYGSLVREVEGLARESARVGASVRRAGALLGSRPRPGQSKTQTGDGASSHRNLPPGAAASRRAH